MMPSPPPPCPHSLPTLPCLPLVPSPQHTPPHNLLLPRPTPTCLCQAPTPLTPLVGGRRKTRVLPWPDLFSSQLLCALWFHRWKRHGTKNILCCTCICAFSLQCSFFRLSARTTDSKRNNLNAAAARPRARGAAALYRALYVPKRRLSRLPSARPVVVPHVMNSRSVAPGACSVLDCSHCGFIWIPMTHIGDVFLLACCAHARAG